jgi:alkanesulfonate monooxygenase SsuD/methylene tetrahydromethanopterin reductase-like flavin-dependent oxidoreductase (luciferase family)
VTARRISAGVYGRFAVNVVSGWFKDEFTHLGEPWLEHDERYRRSAEFLQVLRKVWTEDNVDFRGDFYRVHDFTLKPKPLNSPERPSPELFQGGRRGPWPRPHGRPRGPVRGLTGVIIARDTESEACETRREIIAKANRPAVEGFRAAVQQAGNATSDKRGMWANSTFEDLVQYNDGFRTQLIGTSEQIAERIAAYAGAASTWSWVASCIFRKRSNTSGPGYCRWCTKSKRQNKIRSTSRFTRRREQVLMRLSGGRRLPGLSSVR